MSIGQDRVRLTTKDSTLVLSFRQRVAQLIDECEGQRAKPQAKPEEVRLWALAMTAFEEGAMWAVKAAQMPGRQE